MEIRDGENDERVLELIGAAVIAGANWSAARSYAVGRGGFEKLARKHNRVGARLCAEICSEAAKDLMSLAASKRASGLPGQ